MKLIVAHIFVLIIDGIFSGTYITRGSCDKVKEQYQEGECLLVEVEIPLEIVIATPKPFCRVDDNTDCYQYQTECESVAYFAGTECSTQDQLVQWDFGKAKFEKELVSLLSEGLGE